MTVDKANAHNVPVNVHGESAGRSLEAMALLGLGLRAISMAPAAVGPIKTMVLALDQSKLEAFMKPLLRRPEHSLRSALEAYSETEGIPAAA